MDLTLANDRVANLAEQPDIDKKMGQKGADRMLEIKRHSDVQDESSMRTGVAADKKVDKADQDQPVIKDMTGGADAEGVDRLNAQQRNNGKYSYILNEAHPFLQQARQQLDMPIFAGVSGTTNRMMQCAQLLGESDMIGMRSACVAYMIPIQAHSWSEIMESAAAFGCAYTPGDYESMAGIDIEKVRAIWKSICEANGATAGAKAGMIVEQTPPADGGGGNGQGA